MTERSGAGSKEPYFAIIHLIGPFILQVYCLLELNMLCDCVISSGSGGSGGGGADADFDAENCSTSGKQERVPLLRGLLRVRAERGAEQELDEPRLCEVFPSFPPSLHSPYFSPSPSLPVNLKRRAHARLTSRCLAVAFDMWGGLMEEIRARRDAECAAAAAAKAAESAAAAAEQRKAVLMTRVCRKLQNRCASGALESWRTGVWEIVAARVEEERKRVVLARALGRLLQRSAAAALERWLAAVSELRRARRCLTRAACRMRFGASDRAFCAWLEHTEDTKLSKLYAELGVPLESNPRQKTPAAPASAPPPSLAKDLKFGGVGIWLAMRERGADRSIYVKGLVPGSPAQVMRFFRWCGDLLKRHSDE